MARYKFLALSNTFAGKDADFNDWYDNQHLGDVLNIPGFVAAERAILEGDGAHRYLAIYEIETEDLQATLEELARRAGTDAMPISDTLDVGGVQTSAWRVLGGAEA